MDDNMFAMPKDAELAKLQLTMEQPIDSGSTGYGNRLALETRNSGGGNYLVIRGRWALDSAEEVDEFADTLKKFLDLVK